MPKQVKNINISEAHTTAVDEASFPNTDSAPVRVANPSTTTAAAPAAVQQFDTLADSVVVSLTDASAVSGRSRASLYRHFKAGELTLVKIGHSTRVRVGELRKLIGVA